MVDTLAIARYTLHQAYRQLRAEARRNAQGVTNVVMSAAREIERAQLRIDLLVVGYRRYDLALEHFNRNCVLDAHAHRMAGEPLGVGDHQLLGVLAECMSQGVYLGAGASAAGGCVGLVGDEDSLRRHQVPIETVLVLHPADEGVHCLGDVLDVQARTVESAVDDGGAEQARESGNTPSPAFC